MPELQLLSFLSYLEKTNRGGGVKLPLTPRLGLRYLSRKQVPYNVAIKHRLM